MLESDLLCVLCCMLILVEEHTEHAAENTRAVCLSFRQQACDCVEHQPHYRKTRKPCLILTGVPTVSHHNIGALSTAAANAEADARDVEAGVCEGACLSV